MALTDKIIKIANKTRELTGLTNKMTLDEIPSNMDLIKTKPNLQNKIIEIIENGTTNIVADSEYDGLGNVEVVTNVPSSGETSQNGFVVVKEADTKGYPIKIKIVGRTTIPSYCFHNQNTNIQTYFKNLTTVELPESVYQIGYQVFQYCTKLNIKTLPYITEIFGSSFHGCTSLTQMSLQSITGLFGTASSSGTNGGVFMGCTALKAVWLGSGLTTIGQYAFYNTALKKLFIDLPRATVTKWAGANYAFTANTNNTNVLICNDDEGFMTKEEFDAIDWATYTV